MSQIGLSGGVVSILATVFAIFKYFNHRNIRSHCCGRNVEVGIDVDTPSSDTIERPSQSPQ
jgi:hypothetical protein